MDRYSYFKYTILLGATRALAHIGIHFTHCVFGLSLSYMDPLKLSYMALSRTCYMDPRLLGLVSYMAFLKLSHMALLELSYMTLSNSSYMAPLKLSYMALSSSFPWESARGFNADLMGNRNETTWLPRCLGFFINNLLSSMVCVILCS